MQKDDLTTRVALQGITPVIEPPATIKAFRSPERRPRSRQSSPKVAFQQAISPIARIDRNGSTAVPSSSDSTSEDESNPPAIAAAAAPSTAGIWRKVLLVSQQLVKHIQPNVSQVARH